MAFLDDRHYPVIVIGGGQAGLAMSFCLKTAKFVSSSWNGGGLPKQGGPNAGTRFVWLPRSGSVSCPGFPIRPMIRMAS